MFSEMYLMLDDHAANLKLML